MLIHDKVIKTLLALECNFSQVQKKPIADYAVLSVFGNLIVENQQM